MGRRAPNPNVTLDFHPAVQSDFNAAVACYEAEAGKNLADRFEAEFRRQLEAIKVGPTQFAYYHHNRIFRRCRLPHFPYLIIYRESTTGIRITLLKHERRHPLFGMAQW